MFPSVPGTRILLFVVCASLAHLALGGRSNGESDFTGSGVLESDDDLTSMKRHTDEYREGKAVGEWPQIKRFILRALRALLEARVETPRPVGCKALKDVAVAAYAFRSMNVLNEGDLKSIAPQKDAGEMDIVDFRGCFTNQRSSALESAQRGTLPMGYVLGNFSDLLDRALVEASSQGMSGNKVLVFDDFVFKSVNKEEVNVLGHLVSRGMAAWRNDGDVCRESALTPIYFAIKPTALENEAAGMKDVDSWWVLMDKIDIAEAVPGYKLKKGSFYDLKGPTWSSWDGKSGALSTLWSSTVSAQKDYGLKKEVQADPSMLALDACGCRRLERIISEDVTLLRELGVTDYSLIVSVYEKDKEALGVEPVPPVNFAKETCSEDQMCPANGPTFPLAFSTAKHWIAVAIIDFGETHYKSSVAVLSTMTHPDRYAQTFLESLPGYFGCPRESKEERVAHMKRLNEEGSTGEEDAALSNRAESTECQCPVQIERPFGRLIQPGRHALTLAAEDLARHSLPAQIKVEINGDGLNCEMLSNIKGVDPRIRRALNGTLVHARSMETCSNAEGWHVGRPRKFLGPAVFPSEDFKLDLLCDDCRVSFSKLEFAGPTWANEWKYGKPGEIKANGFGSPRKKNAEANAYFKVGPGPCKTLKGRGDDEVLERVMFENTVLKEQHAWPSGWYARTLVLSSVEIRRDLKIFNFTLRYAKPKRHAKWVRIDVCKEVTEVALVSKDGGQSSSVSIPNYMKVSLASTVRHQKRHRDVLFKPNDVSGPAAYHLLQKWQAIIKKEVLPACAATDRDKLLSSVQGTPQGEDDLGEEGETAEDDYDDDPADSVAEESLERKDKDKQNSIMVGSPEVAATDDYVAYRAVPKYRSTTSARTIFTAFIMSLLCHAVRV